MRLCEGSKSSACLSWLRSHAATHSKSESIDFQLPSDQHFAGKSFWRGLPLWSAWYHKQISNTTRLQQEHKQYSHQASSQGRHMSSSEICKQLLLSCRQCLVMVHGGQGCVVIKVAGIIQGLHHWPAPTYCCTHKLKYACNMLV